MTIYLLLLPVLLAFLYALCVLRVLPGFLHRRLEHCITLLLTVFVVLYMRGCNKFKRIRSDYTWDTRRRYRDCTKRVVDCLMGVSNFELELNTSTGAQSIYVDKAVATYEGVNVDVTDTMDAIWMCSDGLQANFPLSLVLRYTSGVATSDDEVVRLRVRYMGHSDVSKRIPFQTYTVTYSGRSSDVTMFPPYPSDLVLKKGLGVPKIHSAVSGTGKNCLTEALESAGLRCKFYKDVKDPIVQKDVVSFLDESDEIQENFPVRVETSKGAVKCNRF